MADMHTLIRLVAEEHLMHFSSGWKSDPIWKVTGPQQQLKGAAEHPIIPHSTQAPAVFPS